MTDKITLSDGAGGQESQKIVEEIRKSLGTAENWHGTNDDSAYMKFGDKYIVFTADSFVASPLFFPGGDIGKIAACGTINDLAVMGAKPLGISLSLVIEEGFSKESLKKILSSVRVICEKENIPVATGDTKVMEKGKIDKLIINTSGVGLAEKIFIEKISAKDKVIVSGAIAEHGAAVLTERFGYSSDIKSDAKSILKEITSIKEFIKQARDPTRGGISATLNELAKKNSCGFVIDEEKIPIKKEAKKICEILGLSPYDIASEGRFVCIVSEKDAIDAEKTLQKFNVDAKIIGEVTNSKNVIVKTKFGERILPMPSGNLVPRIC